VKIFEEFQAAATELPASLRNNRDRINLPITGLQEESGKIGALLSGASASGRVALTPEQRSELRDRLADVLWHAGLLCHDAGIPMQDVAAHSIEQLQARAKAVDPEQR
jgi:NTP pyrophosphatase (non-canonical NTP hydrolase)